jgi:hypothetical protein
MDSLAPSLPQRLIQHLKFSMPSGKTKTKTNSEPIFFFSITIVGNPKTKQIK